MTTYILKRLLLIPPMMLGITLISFCMIILAPGTGGAAGGGEMRAGKQLSASRLEVMQDTFHAGKPVVMRYLYWLGIVQPEVSKGQRREWLNKRLREYRETGAVPPPLTAELLDFWGKAKTDEVLAEADKDDKAVTAGYLTRKLREHKESGRTEAPLTPALLDRWDKLASGKFNPADELANLSQEELDPVRVQALREHEPYARFSAPAIEKLMRALNQPPEKRGMIFGDFGKSAQTPSVTVAQRLWDAIPVTVLLNVIGIFIVYLVSIPLGIYSATHHNTTADKTMTVVLYLLYSLPSFWFAILLIQADLMLPRAWQLPIQGLFPDGAQNMPTLTLLWETTQHLFLPVLASSLGAWAALSRYMRSGMIDIIRADYIRTARAKGCSETRVICKHALRNSLIPVITLLAGLLPGLLGGSVIIETIFNIPGMGNLGYNAVLTRDYTILMAEFTITGVLTLLGILCSDIMYVVVDPRISYEKGA